MIVPPGVTMVNFPLKGSSSVSMKVFIRPFFFNRLEGYGFFFKFFLSSPLVIEDSRLLCPFLKESRDDRPRS